jgi:hypothetical protein
MSAGRDDRQLPQALSYIGPINAAWAITQAEQNGHQREAVRTPRRNARSGECRPMHTEMIWRLMR